MHMCGMAMRVIVVTYVVVALSGCVSNGDLVRCDGRLEPINIPMHRATQTVAPADGSESDAERTDRE